MARPLFLSLLRVHLKYLMCRVISFCASGAYVQFDSNTQYPNYIFLLLKQ